MAPTLGDADPWGAEGSGKVMRSMTPVHSLWDLTGFAAMDKENTCQRVPILVVLPGQEREVEAGLLADLRRILLFDKLHTLLSVKHPNLTDCEAPHFTVCQALHTSQAAH